MKAMTRILTLVVAVIMAAPAMADWNVGDPVKMHWPQLPDLDNGMNVLVTYFSATGPWNRLADDFLCTETGPITDIHIWGSWLNDLYPPGLKPHAVPDPGNVAFRLSIYSDWPADQNPWGGGFSTPGELLWERDIQPSQCRWWADSNEDFYDPNTNEIMGTDTRVFQYNFFIDDDPFVQERNTIYWLEVMAFPGSDDARFGWKTSHMHWNDDAVYLEIVPHSWPSYWAPHELIHPDTGKSLDLAFVITPEPATLALLGAGSIVALLKRRRRRG